jgi:putative aldouronate transport system substrate-binding protein
MPNQNISKEIDMKRAITLIVLVVIATSLWAGGATEAPQPSSEGGRPAYLNMDGLYPVVTEPVTLEVLTIRSNFAVEPEDLWVWKWLEYKTGIDFNVLGVESSGWTERRNLIFAANDLPDAFLQAPFTSADLVRFGQVEGQLAPLSGLIEEYGPNIQQVFAEYPVARASVTLLDGEIYSLPAVHTAYNNFSFPRPLIRTNWLERAGVSVPTNLDELYIALKAIKDNDVNQNGDPNDEIPLSEVWGVHGARTLVLSALGLPARGGIGDLVIRDGEVVLPEAAPEYEEFLRYFNRLYTEGLLDREVFTQAPRDLSSKAELNRIGLSFGNVNIVPQRDPYWTSEYDALTPLTSDENDTPLWPGAPVAFAGRYAIAADSDHKEVALRVGDLWFAEDNALKFWYGPRRGEEEIPGYTGWFVEDGILMYDYDDRAGNIWAYMNTYMTQLNGSKLGRIEFAKELGDRYGVEVRDADHIVYWQEALREKVVPYTVAPFPELFVTPEQDQVRREIATSLLDFIETAEAAFITGTRPLSEIPAYFRELGTLRVEEYVQIFQDAYDASAYAEIGDLD